MRQLKCQALNSWHWHHGIDKMTLKPRHPIGIDCTDLELSRKLSRNPIEIHMRNALISISFKLIMTKKWGRPVLSLYPLGPCPDLNLSLKMEINVFLYTNIIKWLFIQPCLYNANIPLFYIQQNSTLIASLSKFTHIQDFQN